MTTLRELPGYVLTAISTMEPHNQSTVREYIDSLRISFAESEARAEAAEAELASLRSWAASIAAQEATSAETDARDAAMFRFLAHYPNLHTVSDLLRKDQYATLRRACEALMPFDSAIAQEAGREAASG